MTRKQQKRSTLAEFADWLAKTKLPKLDQNGPWDHDAIGEGIAAGALPTAAFSGTDLASVAPVCHSRYHRGGAKVSRALTA